MLTFFQLTGILSCFPQIMCVTNGVRERTTFGIVMYELFGVSPIAQRSPRFAVGALVLALLFELVVSEHLLLPAP